MNQTPNCTSNFGNNQTFEFNFDISSDLLAVDESIQCFLTNLQNASTPASSFEFTNGLFDHNAIRNVAASINSSEFYSTTLDPPQYEWTYMFVIVFIIAGGLGNILVCLAVALDKKLQNVTNYFLLSLAVADLLVSLFVMPLGAVPAFLGKLHFHSVK
jgi:hypothetical protein